MRRSIAAFFCLCLFTGSCFKQDDYEAGTRSYDGGTILGCSGDIAYEKWTYHGGARGTIVFASGRTEYSDKYHRLADMLAAWPYNLIIYDHYGQGRSDGIRAHADDFDKQHACDMKAIIHQLASKKLPVAVMAHSMGGLVAVRMAQIYPDAAKVYVLGSPMLGLLTGDMTDDQVRQLAEAMCGTGKCEDPSGEPAERVSCEENTVTHDCDFYDAFKDDEVTHIGRPTFGWLRAFYEAQDKIAEEMGVLGRPFLVMQAGDEQVVDTDAQTKFCEQLDKVSRGGCELKVWPEAYHELFNEVEREKVVEYAMDFIETHI